MPNKLPTPCCYPACRNVSHDRYCDKHKRQEQRRYDKQRGSAASRGYDSRWAKARQGYLRSHPLCKECEKHGRLTPANTVDHIVPHKGDYEKFWDKTNWQSLCHRCHSIKTAKEDGGFGN